MSVRVFVGLLGFAFASTAVCSDLKCYHCERNQTQGGVDDFCRVPSPSQPGNNTVENCTGQRFCSITRSVDKNGVIIRFSRGCSYNGTCTWFGGCKGSRDGSVMCVSCCDTNLCNKDDAPVIASTTPVSRSTAPVPRSTTLVPWSTTLVPSSDAQTHCTSLFLILFVVLFALL